MRKPSSQFPAAAVALVALALTSCLGQEPKNETKKETPVPLSQLSLEVTALQTLRFLDVNESQLKSLRQLTKQTLSKAQLRQDGKGTDKFRRALLDLHRVLVANNDQRPINELNNKLELIREEEKPQLDDEVLITDEARRRAADAGRLLSAGQVVSYLGLVAEEMDGPLDPRERLIEAIANVRDLTPEKWKESQDGIAFTLGRLSAGVDAQKAERIGKETVQLLTVVRGLSDAEFKSQKPELERKAQKIVGEIGPFEVVRNVVEYTLAELLSNPRLPQVIDARLKQEAAKKSDPER
jgi:hypothetical protein